MTRRRNRLSRPGMTMIELLVAVGILVVMIAGVGYVFTSSSTAVRATQATIETNSAVRATMARIREDLQSLSNDGVLLICNATTNGGREGDPTATILMFTATGRFESRMRLDTFGRPVTANAALILYMPVRDAQGGPDILARYVFLLTGDRSLPFGSLLALIGTNTPSIGQLDGLCREDCLSASLADVRMAVVAAAPNSFADMYVWPLFMRYAQLNSAPQTISYAGGLGGVDNLWPYMIGGCDEMAISFRDGREADGTTPADGYPDYPVPWVDPNEDSVRDTRREDGGSLVVGITAMPGGNQPPIIIWDYRAKDRWPDALQIRASLRDAPGRLEKTRWYESVFALP